MSARVIASGLTQDRTFAFPDASATILTTNTAVTPAQGGTGIASYAVGDLLYASAAAVLSKLAGVAIGQVLVSGGVATAPAWSASPTLTSVLNKAGAALTIGTSDAQQLSFNVAGSTRWYIDGSTVILAPLSDNSVDFGATAHRIQSGFFGTSVEIGTNPATSGGLRLGNNTAANARNAANSANLTLFTTDASNAVYVGDSGQTLVLNGGDILWKTPLVALGTTTLITLGKTGGSGPATAAQNSWMRVLDSTGAAFWVPAWK